MHALIKIKPLNPKIKIWILIILLPLFISYRSSGEKLIKYQANSSCVIMSVILMTTLFYKALILQGEIWCWSLLRWCYTGRFVMTISAQHSVTTLLLHWFERLQYCFNIWTLCCAKNRRIVPCNVTFRAWKVKPTLCVCISDKTIIICDTKR